MSIIYASTINDNILKIIVVIKDVYQKTDKNRADPGVHKVIFRGDAVDKKRSWNK